MFTIFKKRKNILAVILTSSDVKKARRVYESLKNSSKSVTMDIDIIVNTLNKKYINEVRREFKKDKLLIVETESNGLCGKGKNSVLDHFRNHKNNYDYLLPIDGDDFFYPSAFEQFEKALSVGPDILGLQISDELISVSPVIENPYVHKVIDNVALHSWNDEEWNLSKKFPKDVSKPVLNQTTPDRTMLLSEKLLKEEKKLCFPENLVFYDDYSFNVRLFEAALNRNYSYAQFTSSYCYIYDKTNEASVSKEKIKDPEKVNMDFYNSIKDYLEKCDGKIDFGLIHHLKIGVPKKFDHEEKLDFIKKNIM